MGNFASLPFLNTTIKIPINKPCNESRYYVLTENGFSVIYDSELKSLTIYFIRAPCMSSNLNINVKFDINSTQNIKTTTTFSKAQPYFVIQNVEAPFLITAIAKSSLLEKPRLPYIGIYNLGLTCYINSSIQLLMSVPQFEQLIYAQNAPENSICGQLQQVFTQLRCGRSPVNLRPFVRSFGKDTLQMVASEQDAHEFITTLFDKLDHELGKEFEKQREEIFSVTETRVLECPAAKKHEEVDETTYGIQVPVQGFSSLYEALKDITATEKLEGDNKWDAGEKFGKLNATRFVRFKKLPPAMMFHLCRFAYNKRTMRIEEIKTDFDCPQEIDMKDFCLGDVGETRYKLVSVIAHRGNPQSGHYVNFGQPGLDNNWYLFNDSNVTSVTFSHVQKTFGQASSNPSVLSGILNFINHTDFIAYVVGYIRVNNLSKRNSIPAQIAPHLSNELTARVLTPQDLRTELHKSGHIVEADPNSPLEKLFENTPKFIFYSPPKSHSISLIDGKTLCGQCLICGFSSLVFGCDVEDPIFVITGDNISVESKKDYKPPEDSEIICHESGLTPKEIKVGELYILRPKGNVKLIINKKEFEFARDATYEDVQKAIHKKNPSSVILTSSGYPLIPRQYPTVGSLLHFTSLSNDILPSGASANSIDLLQRIRVLYFGASHKPRDEACWVKPNSTYMSVISNYGSKDNYLISPYGETGVTQFIRPESKIETSAIRIDYVPCFVPISSAALLEYLSHNKNVCIEVRSTEVGTFRRTRGHGFVEVKKNTKVGDIAKSLKLLKPSSASFVVPFACRPIPIQLDDTLFETVHILDEVHPMQRPILAFIINIEK